MGRDPPQFFLFARGQIRFDVFAPQDRDFERIVRQSIVCRNAVWAFQTSVLFTSGKLPTPAWNQPERPECATRACFAWKARIVVKDGDCLVIRHG
jgi:hypothetical protein